MEVEVVDLEPGKSSDTRGWRDRAAAEQVIKEAVHRAGVTATGSGSSVALRVLKSAARGTCYRPCASPGQ